MQATRSIRTAAAAAAMGLATASSAQTGTICWQWSLVDTAGNIGFVDVGESALLTLSASFDPPNHGFAQAGPYNITGDAEWQAGSIRDANATNRWPTGGFDNLLFFSVGFGELQADNSITGIENFQVSQFFNPTNYKNDNPIAVYFIEWTPDHYAGQSATVTNGAPDGSIYINELGNSVTYTGNPNCGSITFQVLPTPGSVALLGLGALAAVRRRRR